MAATNEAMTPDYDEACTSASEFDDLDIKQAAQFGDLSISVGFGRGEGEWMSII